MQVVEFLKQSRMHMFNLRKNFKNKIKKKRIMGEIDWFNQIKLKLFLFTKGHHTDDTRVVNLKEYFAKSEVDKG